MGLVGKLRLQLGSMCVVALGGACSDSGSTASNVPCEGGVAVQSGAMCLFTGAITDGEHTCPPELPYRYSGEGWWLCSDRDDLDTAAIDAAVSEGGVDTTEDGGACRTNAECAAGQVCMENLCVVADGSTDDGSTDDGSTDDGSTDDGSTDDGVQCRTDAECAMDEVCSANVCVTSDGSTDDDVRCRTDEECAVGQVCVANVCVVDDGNPDDGNTDDGNTDDDCIDADGDGRCDPGAPGTAAPTPFLGACLVDDDADGSCAGLDPDDTEPRVRNIGLWTNEAGQTDMVVCGGEDDLWGRVVNEGALVLPADQCVGIDLCLLDPAMFEGLADPSALIARQAALCAGHPGGYAESEMNFSGAELVCQASDASGAAQPFCWYELTPCTDASGALIECAVPPEGECRDDNRDGFCD